LLSFSAVGVPPSRAAVDTARIQLTQRGSTHTSSMYRDLQKGHHVEADEIIGDLARRGREAGITAPLLAAAYAHQRLCGSHGDLRTPSRLPLDATAISLVTRAGSRLLIYRGGPDELAASA
jgi:hypothetical protein